MYAQTTASKEAFAEEIQRTYGPRDRITRPELQAVAEKLNSKLPAWLTNDLSVRLGRGVYSLAGMTGNKDSLREQKSMRVVVSEEQKAKVKTEPVPVSPIPQVREMTDSLVPQPFVGYVPFGFYNDVRAIIRSKKFYPTYITGLSGNGKSLLVKEACAQEGREYIRTNITRETDEDDLIGGFRLINGETVWQNGPVIIAMERGAICLLDEVDLGDEKLMCLQPILEGEGYYIKKINKMVYPKPGFNLFATANTKGQGSEDGRFIGTRVMNEAFLDRWAITFEQPYPDSKTEEKIVNNALVNTPDADFAKKLVLWADVVRKTFFEGAINEIISTRRLVNIAEAFSIFGRDRPKAINYSISRFDKDTKDAFLDLYSKIDGEPSDPMEKIVGKDTFAEMAF